MKIKASLAPMAGYTDSVFRQIAQNLGTAYTVSEMISSLALVHGDTKTAALAEIGENEKNTVLQIFGHDPAAMAEAAEILLSRDFPGCSYKSPPAGIDINMGCPVKKITSSGDGSALMKNPDTAAKITEACAAVCRKYSVPLSVKLRLGWDEKSINAPEFAKLLAESGADKLTLHTRTRELMYAPSARPEFCLKVREAVPENVVLVGNGDISSLTDAEKYLSLGCSEVAVGRAALGNPWLFTELSTGEKYIPDTDEVIDLAVEFTHRVVKLKGEYTGVREARGRAAHFIKGMRGSAGVRDKLNHAETEAEFAEILYSLREPR